MQYTPYKGQHEFRFGVGETKTWTKRYLPHCLILLGPRTHPALLHSSYSRSYSRSISKHLQPLHIDAQLFHNDPNLRIQEAVFYCTYFRILVPFYSRPIDIRPRSTKCRFIKNHRAPTPQDRSPMAYHDKEEIGQMHDVWPEAGTSPRSRRGTPTNCERLAWVDRWKRRLLNRCDKEGPVPAERCLGRDGRANIPYIRHNVLVLMQDFCMDHRIPW